MENQKKFKEIDHFGDKYHIKKETSSIKPELTDIKDLNKVIASSWKSILVLGSKKLTSSLKPGVSYNVELTDIVGNTVEIPIIAHYQHGIISLASSLGDRVINFVKVNFKPDNFSNLNLSKTELTERMELPLLLIEEIENPVERDSNSGIAPGSVVVFKSIINGSLKTARVVHRLALGVYLLDTNLNLSLLVPTLFIYNDILETNNVKKVVISPCRLAYSEGKIVGAVNCNKNSIKKFVKNIVHIEAKPIFYEVKHPLLTSVANITKKYDKISWIEDN